MIGFSAAAVQEVQRLRRRHPGQEQAFLRLSIQPTGCAGFSYQLEFSDHQDSGDRIFDCDGIRVAIDAQSLPYLEGLTLDYSEDLMGGSFRFNNPNAKQTCSCGHSFALESLSSIP
jgi:iron-sulfur cluster assembly accessory protein